METYPKGNASEVCKKRQSKLEDLFEYLKASRMKWEAIIIILVRVVLENELRFMRHVSRTYTIKAIGNDYTIDMVPDRHDVLERSVIRRAVPIPVRKYSLSSSKS